VPSQSGTRSYLCGNGDRKRGEILISLNSVLVLGALKPQPQLQNSKAEEVANHSRTWDQLLISLIG
jgi:hypothetical protein